jgi:hypothetical protein
MFAAKYDYQSTKATAAQVESAMQFSAPMQFMCQTVANDSTCSATCHGLGLKKGNCAEGASACRCCE